MLASPEYLLRAHASGVTKHGKQKRSAQQNDISALTMAKLSEDRGRSNENPKQTLASAALVLGEGEGEEPKQAVYHDLCAWFSESVWPGEPVRASCGSFCFITVHGSVVCRKHRFTISPKRGLMGCEASIHSHCPIDKVIKCVGSKNFSPLFEILLGSL